MFKVEEAICINCLSVCARIIMKKEFDPSLQQAAVNVMAAVPHSMTFLLAKVEGEIIPDEVEFGGFNMQFPDAVLKALNARISAATHDDYELLGTYFTVLIYLCNESKEARRYIRLKVMPPLRAAHVERRPDEGNTLRNKMIRVMTSASNSRQLAAEFLFILCKRSVARLMKYCGFGHSAGLLANYGFLGAINQPKRASDSEDSETEDYKEVEPMINPVTGWIEPPHVNPLEGMSEEQKEYEAVQLANTMSALMDQGIIAPGTIGEDGRVRPVKHVLELTEKTKLREEPQSDSDVD